MIISDYHLWNYALFSRVARCSSRVADVSRRSGDSEYCRSPRRNVTHSVRHVRALHAGPRPRCSQKWIIADRGMDYKARRRYTAVADVLGLNNDYPHDIQMYDVPPVGEMSMEEFQELGLDRLKGNLLGPSLSLFKFNLMLDDLFPCSATDGGDDELQRRPENVGGSQESLWRFSEI